MIQHSSQKTGPGSLAMAALMLVLLHCPSRAVADRPEPGGELPTAAKKARRLLERAEDLYTAAAFRESLRALKRAARITADPALLGRIHLYMGCNHFELRKRHRAQRMFVTALSHDPALTLDSRSFKAALVRLFEETRRSLKGTISVTADRQGEVLMDGQRVGRTPYHGELSAGWHQVVIRDPGGKREHRARVLVATGGTVEVRGSLAPEAVLPPRPSHMARSRRAAPLYKKWWLWTIVGAAVVGGVVAIAVTAGGDDRVPRDDDGRYTPATY